MILTGTMLNYSVNQGHISVNINLSSLDRQTKESLTAVKGKQMNLLINDMQSEAMIHSINDGKKIQILIHLARVVYHATKLAEIFDSPITLLIETDQVKELRLLLSKVANKEKANEVDLLFQISSFRGKGDKLIAGKKSIYDLSNKQKVVVADKLRRMLYGKASNPDFSKTR